MTLLPAFRHLGVGRGLKADTVVLVGEGEAAGSRAATS